ncbi:Methylxanthine N1-demethylase NdmA [Enhygromyxa salina]|uniref:Methylxanthine N1-demethylase NdmA n=1 Tax=Enhygromyxa salina TaxID=215803 RepID=A0A2S9YGI6_9BACT|nr:aromatic ring-hydroxylating dioxygenase subunit alpha [Enhygromyxa salina]PRQ04220.1 Methylxanthine N1-demethylase NdmA [Enhygromyxa salina]
MDGPSSTGSEGEGRPRLPIVGSGNSSAARVLDDWFVVCSSDELDALGAKPLSTTLYGVPIVVFRGATGEVGALLDRCPHRNVPLSDGAVEGALLRCGYHGWAFDAEGVCREIPTLCGDPEGKARVVPRFAACEQDGVVWVYATPDVEPVREPYVFRWVRDSRYHSGRETFEVDGTIHAVAENALDVPHTAFLHKGLFRKSGAGNRIEVVVRRWHDRAEAEYIGEPRPPGVVGRLLAPQGGVVEHFDRFVLPSITEVEYRLGETSHICTVSALTPITDTRTRLTAVISFRLPVPSFMVTPVLGPLARAIFKQDAAVLERQVANIERFGGESFVSTEVDALGPQILRLLRNAERGDRGAPGERGEPGVEPAHEHRFFMEV